MSPRPRATSDEAILAATYRIVSQRGPNLTLADVAKEAGVSPATLVQRFGSKRGLLLAFASTGAVGMGEEFERIRKKHRSAVAAVYALAECMAGMAVTPETLSNSLAFLQMDLVDPEFHTHALAHSRATHVEMTRLLDDAVAAGELKPCDTRRLAHAVQALMSGSLLQWAIERDGPAAARMREDLEVLLGPRLRPRRRRRRGTRRLRRT
jgi:AcrR family transcriptional regulator